MFFSRASKFGIQIAALIFLVQPPCLALANSLVVISNLSHPVKLTKDDCREIFLGLKTLVDGWRISPLDQPRNSGPRIEFYRLLTGRTPSEMGAYWAEQIFSGRTRQPQVVDNDQAVIQRVLSDPDAIGYVDAAADISKVHVVLKLD